jgi:hypothetical protein
MARKAITFSNQQSAKAISNSQLAISPAKAGIERIGAIENPSSASAVLIAICQLLFADSNC